MRQNRHRQTGGALKPHPTTSTHDNFPWGGILETWHIGICSFKKWTASYSYLICLNSPRNQTGHHQTPNSITSSQFVTVVVLRFFVSCCHICTPGRCPAQAVYYYFVFLSSFGVEFWGEVFRSGSSRQQLQVGVLLLNCCPTFYPSFLSLFHTFKTTECVILCWVSDGSVMH